MKDVLPDLIELVSGLVRAKKTICIASLAGKHGQQVQKLAQDHAIFGSHSTVLVDCEKAIQVNADCWNLRDFSVPSVPVKNCHEFSQWASLLTTDTLVVIYNVSERGQSREKLFSPIFGVIEELGYNSCPRLRVLIIDRSYSQVLLGLSQTYSLSSNILQHAHPCRVVNLDGAFGRPPEDAVGLAQMLKEYVATDPNLERCNITDLVDFVNGGPGYAASQANSLILLERDKIFVQLFTAWKARLDDGERQAVARFADLFFKENVQVEKNSLRVINCEALLKLIITPPRFRGLPDKWNTDTKTIDEFNEKSPQLLSATQKLVHIEVDDRGNFISSQGILGPLCRVINQCHGTPLLSPQLQNAVMSPVNDDVTFRLELGNLISAYIYRRNKHAHPSPRFRLLDTVWNVFFFLLSVLVGKASEGLELEQNLALPAAENYRSIKMALDGLGTGDPRVAMASKQIRHLMEGKTVRGFFYFPCYAEGLLKEYQRGVAR